MTAFSAALVSGALPRLKRLWLADNQISDAAMQAFAAALSGGSGALPQLTPTSSSDTGS